MVERLRIPVADLRGVNRLTIAAIAGVVDLVEAMHHRITMFATTARSRTESAEGHRIVGPEARATSRPAAADHRDQCVGRT